MASIYEISNDYRALVSLLEGMTDDNGETREFTDEEKDFFTQGFKECGENFKTKFDSIYKVYCNFKAEADVAETERAAMKAEMERLSKRAKARDNEAGRLKGLIAYAMDIIKMKKIKTDLFSCGYQSTQKSAREDSTFNIDKIPVEYLKRELSSSAIKKAVMEGRLYEKDDPITRGKLFYLENGIEKFI